MEMQRESVFSSAIRSFFKSIFGVLGIFIGLIVAAIFVFFFTPPYSSPHKTTLVLAEDDKAFDSLLPDSAPVILKIRINGVIGTGGLTGENMRIIFSAAKQNPMIKNRIKGIFLDISTPGGSATDSDTIYTLIKSYKAALKVPVFAFCDSLCASGGMFVASSADRFFASPSSVIGSIGVYFGPNFNVWNFMQSHGVSAKTFSEGKNKTLLSPFEPLPANPDFSAMDALIKAGYERFVSVVAEGRPNLTPEVIKNTLGANIFDAKAALDLGLVDDAGATYYSSMAALATAAGIPQDSPYQVMEILLQESPFDNLVKGMSSLCQSLADHPAICKNQNPAIYYQ